jgi:Malectin domain
MKTLESKKTRAILLSLLSLFHVLGYSPDANATSSVDIAVNSAGPAYTSSTGVTYSADTGFTSGYTDTTTAPVSGTPDQTLYQSNRYGNFSYSFSVPNGTYNVVLKFAETYWKAAGDRVFDVKINGTSVLSNFDIFASAGGENIALDKTFPVNVTGGLVTIQFISVTDNALLCALQIVSTTTASPSPSPTATVTPTPTPTASSTAGTVTEAVNCAGQGYVSAEGVTYKGDYGYISGYTDTTTATVSNTKDSTLYQSNRYGNFSYQFVVANGAYDVTLKFAETYWTAAGDRIFNVLINGTQVLTNFDIFAAAGGENIAIDKTFPVSVTGGEITIQFVSVTDNAMLNALEIVPQPVTPSPSPSPVNSATGNTNFPQIKTGIINYQAQYYSTSFQPTVMNWVSHRFDFVIGGSLDPRPYNSNDTWTNYVDSAYVYSNQIYTTVKSSASARGFNYEDALLHMNVDYQVTSGMSWENLDQFDAFEQPSSLGSSGNPSTAVNGAFLYSSGVYKDVTAQSYIGTQPLSIAQELFLGYAEPFDQVNFQVSTAGTQTITWNYWNGSAWTNLPIRSDSTKSLAQSGQVLFTPPSNWSATTLNGSKSKYWVQATVSGTGSSAVISKIYGDNWLAQSSGSNNCRGWNSTSATLVNAGLGNLEYNPTPPAGATARFRYQARVTGVWAPNSNFGNPNNSHWAQVLEDEALALQGTGSPNAIIFDDGGTAPAPVVPASSIETYTDLGTAAGTWVGDAAEAYSAVAADLHTTLGSQYRVGVNTDYQLISLAGDWSLDEQAALTWRQGDAPVVFNSVGSGDTTGVTYDSFLAANNKSDTAGLMATWSNINQGWTAYDGVWVPLDQGTRGPISALASYYITANPNTYFLYNSFGWSYHEVDEVYEWSTPTQTTAAITSNTSAASKTILATNVSSFAVAPAYGSIPVQIGGAQGDVVTAQLVNGTTLTTTDPIHQSYPVGTTLSYAVVHHQSTDPIPAVANVWKWGPWFPAIAVNVGTPDPNGYNGGARNLSWMTGAASSGNPSACASTACSEVWRRDYTNAIILSRVGHWNTPSSEFNTPSVIIPLGGTYYPLKADGTTASGVTSIQLRGAESAILMKSP